MTTFSCWPIPPKGVLIGLGLGIALLVGGCAQPNTWTKPGITEAGFDTDMASCRRQVSRDTQTSPFAGNGGLEQSDMRDRLIQRCMERKGYRLK